VGPGGFRDRVDPRAGQPGFEVVWPVGDDIPLTASGKFRSPRARWAGA